MKAPHRPTVCQAEDCHNPIEQRPRGSIRLFCQPACQKRQKRKEKKRITQGFLATDATPRPREPDLDAFLLKALKQLEAMEERNGVKTLVKELQDIKDYMKKQTTDTKKEREEVRVHTNKQKQLAKQFADYLAQQTHT